MYTDGEVSGADTQRPGYKALIAASKRREFDAIIVEAQDRLWRDQAEMHDAFKYLRFREIKVYSVATGTDLTDRSGRVLATVMGLKDEAFLEDLRDKTRRGMAGQVRRKFSAGGRAYGYRSIRVNDETRTDSYGQPSVLGYRHVIDKTEAKIVRRIFEMFALGLSPKRIALQLNAENIPPPRPKRGRTANGWTWTTISGSRNKGTGILNNDRYRGIISWNRTEKVRHPDTGKRIPRQRAKSEWLCVAVPELRIISEDLWDQVKTRPKEATNHSDGGRRNRRKHLFSGQLKCGKCGSHYIIRDSKHYVCSFHRNRGPHVCGNRRVVRRTILEERLLSTIEREILSPQNVRYLIGKVEETLHRLNTQSKSGRRALEAELDETEREAEHIKNAVRYGKATATLLAMLEQTEARIERLRADLSSEPKARMTARIVPSLVEDYLRNLRAALGRDTERARYLLQRLLGDVILRPDKRGLVAELRGNLNTVVNVDSDGAGRGICSVPQYRIQVSQLAPPSLRNRRSWG